MADTMVASTVKNDHNSRKNKKPLMEKRRRARINSCLTQLKSLVLQAIKKDSSQFSKLEKADILELTVKHLRTLQRQQAAGVMSQDTTVVSKYRAGFNECAKEVVRYMGSVREVNEDVRERVVTHLASCLQVVNQMTPMESLQQHQQQMKPLHVHIPAAAQQQQQQQQQQPINAGCGTTVAPPPSVIMHTAAVAPTTTLPGAYAHVSSSPMRSTSSSPQDHHHQTPSPVSATPLPLPSALPLQTAAMTTAATTVVGSPAAASHISGAFKLVPSGAGAVAVYVGAPEAVPRGAAAPNTVSVDAVPLYSVSLPHPHPHPPHHPPPHHANPTATLTAFVTPPPTTSTDSRYEDVSPVKMEYSPSSSSSVSSSSSPHSSSSSLGAALVPVDLRQTPRSKESCSPCHSLSSGGGHCSPALADDKLWRPW